MTDPNLSAFQAARARLDECRLAFSSAGLALVKAQEEYDRVVREYLETVVRSETIYGGNLGDQR